MDPTIDESFRFLTISVGASVHTDEVQKTCKRGYEPFSDALSGLDGLSFKIGPTSLPNGSERPVEELPAGLRKKVPVV